MATKKRGQNEGGLYQRESDGRWVGAVDLGFVNGMRKRKTVYGKTQAEALSKLRALERERDAGRDLTVRAETVETFLNRWIRDVVEPGRSPKTTAGYRDIVRNHLIPGVGRHKLANLKPEHVAAMLRQKTADGLSPRTVHHIRAVLRVALNQALRWGLVTRNAAKDVESPRQDDKRVEPHKPADVRALIAAVEGDRLALAYRLGLMLGMRQGEILGLRWSDVDLDRGRVEIRQALQRQIHNADGEKGERSRLVPKSLKTAKSRRTLALPKSVVDAFVRHRDAQAFEQAKKGPRWIDSGLVITTPTGGPLEPRALLKAWHDAQERAGLTRRSFHTTRHAAASVLIAQGLPLKTVQEVLGHSLIGTTADIYGHLAEEAFIEAADAMERAMTGT